MTDTMVEESSLGQLEAIFEHKNIEELQYALLQCKNNIEAAVEMLLGGSETLNIPTTDIASDSTDDFGQQLGIRSTSSRDHARLHRHGRDTLNYHRPTVVFLPPQKPTPPASSLSSQYNEDAEMAKRLAAELAAEDEMSLAFAAAKPTMFQTDRKSRPTNVPHHNECCDRNKQKPTEPRRSIFRPPGRRPQQQRRCNPGPFNYPAARVRPRNVSSIETETIDFTSDETRQLPSIEQIEHSTYTDDNDENDEDLRSALAASMAPSDLGRLGGFGKEMTTYDAKALEMLLSDPDFISSLDEDLRAAIDLQRKIDAEERSISLATGEASKVCPGSLAPPIRIDSVSYEDEVADNCRHRGHSLDRPSSNHTQSNPPLSPRSTKIAESAKAQLRRILKRRLEMEHARKLARQLEALNDENHREQSFRDELQRMKQEAETLCLKQIKDHLDQFLQHHPNGSYEDWIEELHPENVHEGQLLEGLEKVIDHRFYVEGSDHRKLWNECVVATASVRSSNPSDKKDGSVSVGTGRPWPREIVPARHFDAGTRSGSKNHGTSGESVDLLSSSHEEGKHHGVDKDYTMSHGDPPDPAGDLILFG